MLNKGLFITFEGSDGTGKSTQISNTHKYLSDKGFGIVLTREPGGTKISELLREILLDGTNREMSYGTEALLYAAARAQHVNEIIEPALLNDKVVICDRFIDSSLAYQGYARGLGIETVDTINRLAIGGIMPDITFLMILPAKIAIKRREHAGELDRIEKNGEGFMQKVNRGYEILAKKYPDRIVSIDAAGNEEEVFNRIKEIIDKKINFRGPSV